MRPLLSITTMWLCGLTWSSRSQAEDQAEGHVGAHDTQELPLARHGPGHRNHGCSGIGIDPGLRDHQAPALFRGDIVGQVRMSTVVGAE